MIKHINKEIEKRFSIDPDGEQPLKGTIKYSRKELYKLFKDVNFSKGAEIGVFRGENAKCMCEIIPKLKLICIDTWNDYHKENGDKLLLRAKNRLKGYDVEFKRLTSMEAISQVKDESLDFIYIDANHLFDAALQDITKWSKKVRSGGIISGHDYHRPKSYGVISAVKSYVKTNNIEKFYLTNDRKPSFFMVKK